MAYTAHMDNNHGKGLDTPAYARLVAAAGGKDQVAAYCAAILAEPTPPGNSGKKPTAYPSKHPGKKPSTHPGQ